MTNYAKIQYRDAYLSTEFGEELARKWFGDETVDSLPRFLRGPRKGKIKGVVTWAKIVQGGWVRGDRETASGQATGYVERRVGLIFDRKLHELESGRNGTFAGNVIRDLDKENRIQEEKKLHIIELDKQIRYYEKLRSNFEELLISDKLGELYDNEIVLKVIREEIKDYDEDVKVLLSDLKKKKGES
jgi:hypothetical protein